MAVGIVVVSHSRGLAEAAVEVAMQMVRDPIAVALAAGLPDGSLGTDATAVATAVAEVDHGDGVVVLVDMGSAILSAELGIELYGKETDVRILPAPFVEGLVVAAVMASTGASIDDVTRETNGALLPKTTVLGDPY